MTSLQDDLRVLDKGLGSGGSWRGTRLRLPTWQSGSRELTIAGVNGAYYMGDFVFMNLECTGYLPVVTFYLANQVDGELTFGGVDSAHYTGVLCART